MNGTPRVFLGSSTEVAEYMRALETELGGMGFATVPWHGNFGLARNTLDELWRMTHEVDFAVFVWAADVMHKERGRQRWATRDNVVYEAGLFAGVLSPQRVFLVVEAGVDIKIPSDYLGIGFASFNRSDEASIRRAAGEIRTAIDRAVRELEEGDPTRLVAGLWADAVVNRDEKSVISLFELRHRAAGTLDIVNGRAWDPDGELRAQFWSTSSRFDPATHTLTYSWQGIHPREAVVSEHFGVGSLSFDPEQRDRATGWFSWSPRSALDQTILVSRSCLRASEADAVDLFSDDRQTRRQAVQRLLNWREQIR
ncbi:MAG: nucleotide-binding protein [Rhodocyclaceae bacterium]|nr:nucleotide-binding protein [Rhodocyclaceae bacterium]